MNDPNIKKKILDMLTKEYPKDFSIKEIKDFESPKYRCGIEFQKSQFCFYYS